MKLPKVNGKYKIRNAKIISLYVKDHLTGREIAEKMGTSPQRIYQILDINKEYIKFDVQYEKTKMVNRLLREIDKKPESNRDVTDLMEQARKLLEGDKQQENKVPIIQIINYEDTRRIVSAEPVRVRDFEESVTVQEHQLASPSEKDDASPEQAGS